MNHTKPLLVGALAVCLGLTLAMNAQERKAEPEQRSDGAQPAKALSAADAQASIMPKPRLALGNVERLDSAIDQLLPANAQIEILAGGFDWAEGPVWVPADKRLLFSDVPRNIIY